MALFDGISKLAEKALKSARSGRGPHIEAHVLDANKSKGDETVALVQSLREEARRKHGPIEDEAIRAVHEYMGNQWETQRDTGSMLDSQYGTTVLQATIREHGTDDDLVRPVINRTQNAVLSNTEARTSRPVEIRFEPEETGEPEEFWMSKRGAETLMQLRSEALVQVAMQESQLVDQQLEASMQPMVGDAAPPPDIGEMEKQVEQQYPDIESRYDQEHGLTAPLSESEAGAVQELIAQGLLVDSDLIRLNDDVTASVLQQVITRLNRDANLDGKYLRAANYSTNGGYHFLRFSYNARGSRKHGLSLETMPIKSVWIDPYHDDIMDSDYLGEDRMVSLERARVMHPEIGDELLALGSSEGGSLEGSLGQEGGYQRAMVQITTCWLRHHTVPVSEERAVREGWVEIVDQEIAEIKDIESLLQEDEGEGKDEEKGKVPGEEPKRVYILTEEGAEHVGGSAKKGEEVEPQIERSHQTNWPDAEGLRQVVIIDGIDDPVQDIRCPYWDIPYLLFVNVPRADGSPLGQGDAIRLEDIQREINRVAAIIINNQRMAQFPTYFIPQTLWEQVNNTGVGFFLQPGQENILPDSAFYNILQSGGFDRMVMNPPRIDRSSMELLDRLMAEHDALSGNVGVRQGRAPSGVTAGVAIAQLQEHATGTLALKARLDEHALTRYGRLEQHAATSWLPETEWARVASKYSLPVLRRIIERATNLACNIKVSVAAGRGIAKQLDRAQAMEMFQSGLATVEDTLARMEESDPKKKADKILQERGVAAPGGALGNISLDSFAPGPQG